jgi:hypothetical protein
VEKRNLSQHRRTTPLSHIAIVEALNGKTVEWLEKVSDEHYLNAASAICDLTTPRAFN